MCYVTYRYHTTGTVKTRHFDSPFDRALWVIMLAPYADIVEQD